MYKLFLTLRYLTRKKIVIFPILVVWLCVMMLVIVSGIMGGFVDRVRETNHDLYGDIIISGESTALGFDHYDELRAALQKDIPQIEASAPLVEVYSLIYVPNTQDSQYAMLVGVDPKDISKVTTFRQALFNQYTAPNEAIESLSKRLPASKEDLIQFARDRASDAVKKQLDIADRLQAAQTDVGPDGIPIARPNLRWLLGLAPLSLIVVLLVLRAYFKRSGWTLFNSVLITFLGLAIITLGIFWPIIFPRQIRLLEDTAHRAAMDTTQAQRTLQFAQQLPDRTFKTRDDLSILLPPEPSFKVPPSVLENSATQLGGQPTLPPDGIIVGSIKAFHRDTRGNFERGVDPLYLKVVLTVFPASSSGNINTRLNNAISRSFTVVDDSHTGVFDVDQNTIYAPFEIVQQMAGLAPNPVAVAQGGDNFPARCQELLIKLKHSNAYTDVRAVRYAIDKKIQELQDKDRLLPEAERKMPLSPLLVQTWDEKQSKYLGAVENEKVMVIFCLGLMSLVVLVVIFLIFYQIVRDKTRDIGIIKAVGGSEEGVAGIFLTFGTFIGVVGGGLGVLGGWLFVTHTNQIHEGIFQATGIVIWDRSVYLFDRIPDVVHFNDVITYFIVAVAAGVLGALIPAVIAALEDPVQAVRHE